MKRFVLVFVVLGLSLVVAGQANAVARHGPGSHWIDSVLAGNDSIGWSKVEFGIDLTFDGIPEFDAVFVGGPTTIQTTAAMDDSTRYPGLRPVDVHLDVIDTEILSMTLNGIGPATGWTLRVGILAGVSTGHGPRSTLGAIAELPGDPALAESFFDVFFEVDGTPFGTIHNDTPYRIREDIDQVPPVNFDYEPRGSDATWVELFDASEMPIGNLTELTTGGSGHHSPEPTTFVMLVIGGLLMGGWAQGRRRRRE